VKITVEHSEEKESEIILRCNKLDEECMQILSMLNLRKKKIVAWKNVDEQVFIQPEDVLYCESVDNKTFVYLENDVFESGVTLALLDTKYEDMGFARISKSTVVNLHGVKSLKSLMGSRIEATMKNDERLIISRRYGQIIREKLIG